MIYEAISAPPSLSLSRVSRHLAARSLQINNADNDRFCYEALILDDYEIKRSRAAMRSRKANRMIIKKVAPATGSCCPRSLAGGKIYFSRPVFAFPRLSKGSHLGSFGCATFKLKLSDCSLRANDDWNSTVLFHRKIVLKKLNENLIRGLQCHQNL